LILYFLFLKILKIILAIVITLAALGGGAAIFMNQKNFGRLPKGERLERIKRSPHYNGDRFVNEVATQQMTGDQSFFSSVWDWLFSKHPRVRPEEPVESIKTDLHSLPINQDLLVWFGHSSYLIQLDGKRILVDPVFEQPSPVGFVGKPFPGADLYKAADMPEVDYMVVSHDHWDHLDYKTQTSMRDRIGQVVTALGVGEHFEYWDFPQKKICEMDWHESITFPDGFSFHCLPTRHFSGRGLSRNKTLWASFIVESPSGKRVFIGGDGGYGPHFKRIGEQFPSIDLAILENGQYNNKWAQIHTLPHQLPQIMKDLHARHYITVHHGKYNLAEHPWDEPLQNERQASQETGVPLTVLTIGQVMSFPVTPRE
jgi:L-ascorbate metabolism protein UlaG (beta-lactamase superfamily)